MENYKVGMYGGKFMPFHKGHMYCIEKAVEQCEKVYVLLFYGGTDEVNILNYNNDEYLRYEKRLENIKKACNERFGNEKVIVKAIDVSKCKYENGEEDWDAETTLVLNAMGKMDAVYSSEPGYGAYFKRAYPWAKHILVDPKRETCPISGTKIRNMKSEEEKRKWMV